MYPQSELDNYKLQVELLQEKLKNSEENRQQLAQQLEKTLWKRNEHDKLVRSKSRQKYQAFLEEQQKRNERNKMLVQMLERIDQQAAAMSARSDRLKMMKMQYEMYFAKLVQSQTLHCLQSTTAAATATTTGAVAPIPVLLPTAAAMAPTSTPTTAVGPSVAFATPPQYTGNYLLNVDTNAGATAALTPRGWALAMATPTPAGMLLTGASPLPQSYFANNLTCDYLQPPFGLATSASQRPMQFQVSATTSFNTSDHSTEPHRNNSSNNGTDALPTLAALSSFDKMTITSAMPTQAAASSSAIATSDDTTPQYAGGSNNFALLTVANSIAPISTTTTSPSTIYTTSIVTPTPTLNSTSALPQTPGTTAMAMATNKDNGPKQLLQQAKQLPEHTSATYSTSSPLTFDKLPKSPVTMSLRVTEENFATVAADASAGMAGKDGIDVADKRYGNYAHSASAYASSIDGAGVVADGDFGARSPQEAAVSFDDFDVAATLSSSNFNFNSSYKGIHPPGGVVHLSGSGTTPTATPTKDDVFTSQSADTSAVSNSNNSVDARATAVDSVANQHSKIEDAWAQPDTRRMAGAWHATARDGVVGADGGREIVQPNAIGVFQQPMHANPTQPESTEPGTDVAARQQSFESMQGASPQTATGLSIENIENAIYGELVNPPTAAEKANMRNVRQELIENFNLTQPTSPANGTELSMKKSPELKAESPQPQQNEPDEYPAYATIGSDDITTISSASYNQEPTASDSYDPTYATIDDATNEHVYQQQVVDSESATKYDEEVPAANYAHYATDANAMRGTDSENAQQDYTNLDYANYDASQYEGAYGPDAYPGYTYDEATGQYTPNDPSQQYANNEAATYGYEQQPYDPNQLDTSYDYSSYAQDAEAADATIFAETTSGDEIASASMESTHQLPESIAPPATDAPVTMATPHPTVDTTVKVAKVPTSILSTPAAPNDAQKKKKRVNFVDSSETDDSSNTKAAGNAASAVRTTTGTEEAASSESDFDFSAGNEELGT